MKSLKLSSLFALLALVFCQYAGAQSVPRLISYQGRVTTSAGQPLSGDTIEMHFSLLDGDSSGASVLWGETHSGVSVQNGLYNVILGGVTPIPVSAFSGSTVFLEVELNGEMFSPRQQLTSVGFAMQCENAAGSDDSDALDGMDSTDFADALHGHNFMELTGNAADSQIPDNITIDYAADSDMLDGLEATAFAGSTHVHDFSELIGTAADSQIPDNITIDYATEAETLNGFYSWEFALSMHSHSFTDMTDSIADSQVPDNITIDFANDAGLLDGLAADAYVHVSGDTVTGSLEVDGDLIANLDHIVYGNLGVGTPSPAGKIHARRSNVTGAQDVYMIRSDVYSGANTGTSYFRALYGYADNNSWGGTTHNYGVYGWANSSANGGTIQNPSFYGLFGRATGTTYGTSNAYGLYATASGADNNWAGYFDAGDVYVNNDLEINGNLVVQGNPPSNIGAMIDGSTWGVYATGGGYGVHAQGGGYGLKADALVAGVDAFADNTYSSGVTGVYGGARNYGTGPAYGGYFYTSSSGNGTHYGVYCTADDYSLYATGGTKSWVNPDPEDPEQAVVYATLEGGENGTYHRGTATLTDGRAVVVLPAHFRKVTSPDHSITVQLTPLSADSKGLAVTKKTNSEIVVQELGNGRGNYDFDYLVQGVRLGYEDYEPIIENVDYVPFQGNLSSMDPKSMTTQEWYDGKPEGMKRIFKMNGTLDAEGRLNEELFEQKGWKVVGEDDLARTE